MDKLTTREQDVFTFITAYRLKNGYSPSMRDICKGCYLANVRSASIYIDRLVKKGYISYTPKVCRSIIIKK